MRVILDRGHGQKAAGAPFDPGVVRGALREVDLAAAYIDQCRAKLLAAGHTVDLLDRGTYDERHAAAIALAAQSPDPVALYVQCHVNAGGGKYGLVEHDARSATGRKAALSLADALDELPEVPTARVLALHPDDRGWVCIDDVYASPSLCAVLYEPFFIDSATHAALRSPDGLRRVGDALAEGVKRFAASLATASGP